MSVIPPCYLRSTNKEEKITKGPLWTSSGVNFKPGTREGLAKVGSVSVVQESGLQTESLSAWGYICICNITIDGLGPGIPYPCGTLSKAVLVTFRWIPSLDSMS